MKIGLFFIAISSLFGQVKPFVYKPDGIEKIRIKENTVYQSIKGEQLMFDLYLPSVKGEFPILIFLNTIGSNARTWEIYKGWGKASAYEGIAAINYDTRPGKVVEDFDSLMAYLKRNEAELEIDPERIAVYAASANMNLGMQIMMDSTRKYIRAGLAHYGGSNTTKFRMDVPVFMVRAGLDNITTNLGVDDLAQRAINAGVSLTFHNYTGGHHGYEIEDDNDYSRFLIKQSLAFIKTHLMNPNLYQSGMSEFTTPIEELIRSAEQLVKEDIHNAQNWQNLGRYQLRGKQFEKCLISYNEALKLGAGNFGDMGLKALEAAAELGDVKSAIFWTSRLQEVGWIGQWNVLDIKNYSRLKNYPDFISVYEEIKKQPNRFEMLSLIVEQGIQKGKERFDESMKFHSNPPYFSETSINWLGSRLLGRQTKKEALEVFMWNVKLYPDSPEVYDSVADAYEALQDVTQAKEWTKKAIDTSKSNTVSEKTRAEIKRLAEERTKRLEKMK